MGAKYLLLLIVFLPILLFGCIGGGGTASPTPAPASQPASETPAPTGTAAASPSPATTPTAEGTMPPSPTETPQATPGPTSVQGRGYSWGDVTACGVPNLDYTYRVTAMGQTSEISYATSDGGLVNGVPTVKRQTKITTRGYDVVNNIYEIPETCRCMKFETVFSGQVVPGACPEAATGTSSPHPDDAQTSYVEMGEEQVSVPAFTGMAKKIHVTSTTSQGTFTSDAWIAPGIKVPVKIMVPTATLELVSYHG